jgi:integrase
VAKKIDYGALYTLRKDGRYVAVIPTENGPKHIYDRDPELLHQKVEAAKNPTPPLFKEVAEMWEEWKWPKISAGTKVCYAPSLRRAVDEYGEMLIIDISPADINNHLEKLKGQGFGKKVISTQKTVYTLIFRYIITSDEPKLKGWLKYNPAAEVKIPRGLREEKREAPEDDVIERIRDNTNKPFGLFARLCINTGFREAEVTPLTWGDIKPSARWGEGIKREIVCTKAIEYADPKAPLKDPKTEAGFRSVPVLPDLEHVLQRPRMAKDTDLIFPGKNGVMTAVELRRAWTNWCAAAGLAKTVREKRGVRNGEPYEVCSTRPALGIHQLRHYYATTLFEAGVDELTAQELLGHADIETTRAIYTHLRNKQKNKSVGALIEYQEERFSSLNSDKKLTKKAP